MKLGNREQVAFVIEGNIKKKRYKMRHFEAQVMMLLQLYS